MSLDFRQFVDSSGVESGDDIPDPVLRAIYEYWVMIRGDRPYPRPEDIDPIQIAPLLQHVILMDVSGDPPDIVYRLAGTNIVQRNGFEIRGKRLLDLAIRDVRGVYDSAMEAVNKAEPRYSWGGYKVGGAYIKAVERVLLPLSPDGKTVTRLFGGVLFPPVVTDTPAG